MWRHAAGGHCTWCQAEGKELTTHVAGKLVDRDVNEHTCRLALESLTPDERQRYTTRGRSLRSGSH